MKNLPITQEVKGHVTRAAAYHLYAKACLTFSTYTDGLGNTTALTDSESKPIWKSKGGGRLPDSERRFVGSQAL